MIRFASIVAAALNNQSCGAVGPRGLVFFAWAWKMEGCGEALTVISQIEPSLAGHVAAFTAVLFFTLHRHSPQQFGQKKKTVQKKKTPVDFWPQCGQKKHTTFNPES